jgi:hypothetical protein
MFEYNGKTFSLEMLEEKAKAEGISLDELLKANPDIKKSGCKCDSCKRTDSSGSEYGLRIGRYFFGFRKDK